jgi:hypothetical protein
MKVYYGEKVHSQPFHALLKKLGPRGRVATCEREGEGVEGVVVSNSNPALIENPGLASASGRVGSESARLWKLYTNPRVLWVSVCYSLSLWRKFLLQEHCVQIAIQVIYSAISREYVCMLD